MTKQEQQQQQNIEDMTDNKCGNEVDVLFGKRVLFAQTISAHYTWLNLDAPIQA